MPPDFKVTGDWARKGAEGKVGVGGSWYWKIGGGSRGARGPGRGVRSPPAIKCTFPMIEPVCQALFWDRETNKPSLALREPMLSQGSEL